MKTKAKTKKKPNPMIAAKIPTTATLVPIIVDAMGDRYSSALDVTIYVAAESLHLYRKLSAELDKLDSYTYETNSDRGAVRILQHPLVQMTSAAQRDAVNVLKVLGLSLSKLEGGDADPIEALEE